MNPEIIQGREAGIVIGILGGPVVKTAFERDAYRAQLNYLREAYDQMGWWEKTFGSRSEEGATMLRTIKGIENKLTQPFISD